MKNCTVDADIRSASTPPSFEPLLLVRDDKDELRCVSNRRIFERGRYSPKRETGTHHFDQLLAQRLQTGVGA